MKELSNIQLYTQPMSKLNVSTRLLDQPVQLHLHNFYELELVLEGSGSNWINGVSLPLSRGLLYLLVPGDTHQIDFDEPLYLIHVGFLPDEENNLSVPLPDGGCVANLNSQKNHGFMIDMFAGLHEARPDMRLILVGDGPLKGDIERSIAERGLTGWVTLLGVRSDVAKLLQAFDVMLLTSLYEGFPNVLVEWQCAGLRSLVSDRVTPDAALTPLVEFLPIDAGAEPWVEALKDAHADPDRALTSGRALAEIREKGFDIAAVAREHEEIYTQTAKIAK